MVITLHVGALADHGAGSNGHSCATDSRAIAAGNGCVGDFRVQEKFSDLVGLPRGSEDGRVIPYFPDLGDCTHRHAILV